MFAGPLPRELKPPGGRVPARRPRGRASPRASLNPERRVPARAPQAPACPRTRALFAASRCATPLAAPSCSPRRPARYAIASRRAIPLAVAALLHVPLVGIAFLHAQGLRSVQYRRVNETGVQKRRSNGASAQKRRSNVTTGRLPMHMSRWRNERHKNCALNWAVRSPLDSRQVFSASPLLPCTRRTEETWAQNATSR